MIDQRRGRAKRQRHQQTQNQANLHTGTIHLSNDTSESSPKATRQSKRKDDLFSPLPVKAGELKLAGHEISA
jgi:hypothetical protein